jgi:hypothetical protein
MRKMAATLMFMTVGFAAAPFLAAHAGDEWKAAPPTNEDFDRVLRETWKQNSGTQVGDSFGEPAARLCIAVPTNPAPDSRSKAHLPLAWHLDFFANAALTKEREKQLRQLDALAKVGLLEKVATTAKLNGETVGVTRYTLTQKGWKASGYARGVSCFTYGESYYLGVTRFEPKVVRDQASLEIYEVHARVGVRSETQIEPWARDREIQAEFPEIKKNLDGRDFAALLVRRGGEWVEYQSMLRDEALKTTTSTANQDRPGRPSISNQEKRMLDELIALPPPTIDEVKKLLQSSHGVGQANPWPIPCLDLPGSEKLPVDRTLHSNKHPRYSVAVFSNKVRTPYDRVAIKTIPYLDMLEKIGVLSRHVETGVAGKGRDAGAVFDAYVFKLTPAYENRIHSRYTECFPLGPPTVEFVDIQIAEKDMNGFPDSSFRYKLKVMYRTPPAWMNAPVLKAGWPELRGVVEHGMACQGHFSFNRKTRGQEGGGGSCWWAFDSYYENY